MVLDARNWRVTPAVDPFAGRSSDQALAQPVQSSLPLFRHKKSAFKDFEHLWLDAGCGSNKQQGCVGMDRRAIKGVDVVHDIETLPWPFEDGTFNRIIMSHVMEHINPSIAVNLMDEMWRVMKVGGDLMLAMPYPGSFGHWQDPTHIKPWNEATPRYFDPECPDLYCIYEPKPWEIKGIVFRQDGNLEIVLAKRDEGYVPSHKLNAQGKGNREKAVGKTSRGRKKKR